MSSELDYDIEQLYIEGLNPVQIAGELDCHVQLVYDWLAAQSLKPFDEWDKDAQNRLIKDIVS